MLAPLFAPSATGRPRVRPTRDILDASFQVLRAGRAWRLLPREFPPWSTVSYHVRGWRDTTTDARLKLKRLCSSLQE